MVRWTFVVLLTFLFPSLIWGQGVPLISHYNSEATGTYPQNWAISQDSSGYLYFGSQAEILLRFDGTDWNWKYKPATGAIRSLQLFNSKIHWGGVGDFGYVESDSLHDFEMISLKDKVDSTSYSFTNIWQMVEFDGKLYHRASNSILVLEEDSITVIETEERIRGMFVVNGELWVQQDDRQLHRLENDKFKKISGTKPFINDRLIAILPYEGYHLLIFRNHGFVKYDGKEFVDLQTEADDYFQSYSLYRAIPISETEIALGFLNGGIILVKNDGTVQNVLNEETGLPTNVIYELYKDREQTVWATSSDGIIKILPNNPVSTIQERNGLPGPIKFIEPFEDRVYIGSTEGVFFIEKGVEVHSMPEIDQLVYDAIQLNETLYVSSTSGLFRIANNTVQNIYEESYYNKLEGFGETQNILFGSRRKSIERVEIHGQTVEQSEVFQSDSDIRQFYIDRNGLWVITYQNEILFSDLNGGEVRKYIPPIKGEHSTIRNISLINNKISLATDGGLFVYDNSSDSFLPDSTFSLYDPPTDGSEVVTSQVFQFEQCSENEIWFQSGQKIRRAVRDGNTWKVIDKPYRLIGGGGSVQAIHCNPDGGVWFGGSEGAFYLADPTWMYDYEFTTNITGVLMHNDSLIYGGYDDIRDIPKFNYSDNELRFTYTAASYINPEENTYRFRLRGYDDEWSHWSEETQKDYTFIPEGTYTFEVQGKNIYEKAGTIDSYTFTVLPPWYRTVWAYLGYILIAMGIGYLAYKIRINAILREQEIRDGIARDLHDELSSTLSSINFFADAINSRKLEEKESNRFLSLITKSSREAKEKVSDIVWVIHSENDDWENLLLRCKRFAADMLDARDIKHTFKVDGNIKGKPAIVERKNIWLIYREILTNIARHSKADHVDIRVHLTGRELHIDIKDDGGGFDLEKIKVDGNGVQNIKERVNQLKGKQTLISSPGEGTHWKISIPLL